jgi:septal ring factor EnvC (AmiA/AmiB activator)
VIYLVVNIVGYLLVALVAGVGVGWLLHGSLAGKASGERRGLGSVGVDDLELAARADAQDEQLRKLAATIRQKEREVEALSLELERRDRRFNAADKLAKISRRLQQEAEQLKEQVRVLGEQLEAAREEAQGSHGASAAMEEVLRSEILELEGRLRESSQEQDRLAKTLEQENRKVEELERQRDLQNSSLQVLHKQLELARKSREGAAEAGG